jgi:hypothetical protein
MFGTSKLLGAFCAGQDLMAVALCAKGMSAAPHTIGSLAWTCAHDESAWATCYRTRWKILPSALPVIAGDEERALDWRDAYGMRAQDHHFSSLAFPCSPALKDLKDFEVLRSRVAASHRLCNLANAVKHDPTLSLVVTELLSSGTIDSCDMGVYVTSATEQSGPTEEQSDIPCGSMETKFVLYTQSGQVLQFSSKYFPAHKEMCALVGYERTPPGYELELVGPFGGLISCEYACCNTMTGSFRDFLAQHEDQEHYTIHVPEQRAPASASTQSNLDRAMEHVQQMASYEVLFEPVDLLRIIRCILEPVDKACKRLTKSDIRKRTSGWGHGSVCADEMEYHKKQRENKYATAVYNLIRWLAQPGIGPVDAT